MLISGASDLAVSDGANVPAVDSNPDARSDDGARPDASKEADVTADASVVDAADAGPVGCTLKSTSAKTPTSATTSGAGNVWSSPGKVTTQDDVGTTTATCCSGDVSQTLLATGFGFTIPSSAEIRGVTVAIRAKANNEASDHQVKLALAGVASGTDLKNASYSTEYVTRSYGDATNTWGLTLTPELVNAVDFGLALRTQKPQFQNHAADVDVVTITVHYCD